MGRPGKFEGNHDQDLAERLYDVIGNGFQEDELGSVDEQGWYGLVYDVDGDDGLYVVEEDSNGFFTIIFDGSGDEQAVRDYWERFAEEYYAITGNDDE